MATPPRPPSRIDGKINPAYTAWRKEHILDKAKANPSTVAVAEKQEQKLDLRVVKLARNSNFVCCAFGDEGGTVHVRVHKNESRKLLKKVITVQVSEEDGETKYTKIR